MPPETGNQFPVSKPSFPMVVPVKTLEAEQVAECAGRPPDPPKRLTTTAQPESRCKPTLKKSNPLPCPSQRV